MSAAPEENRRARKVSVPDSHDVPARHMLVTVLPVFRRAVAAAQRYEALRYGSACHGRIALADIRPRIFDEFYSDPVDAALVRHRRPRRYSSRQVGRFADALSGGRLRP
jgi:hypothetical protein